jgi:LysM repeat protein/lysophospholipase L1-like esterase
MKLYITLAYLLIFLGVNAQTVANLTTQLNLKKELNFIQFHDAAVMKRMISELQDSKTKGYCVIHFGDSHIQGEGPSSVARKNLQDQYGDAGRGMMFPYSAANSYSSILYSTTHTGNWTYAKSFQLTPKLPLGVTGMTVRTDEKNASLTFNLKKTSVSYQKLKVFIKKDSTTFDFNVITNEDNISVKISDYLNTSLPYIEIPITGNQTKITVKTIQNNPKQNQFEFYGMSLETVNQKGLIYHSVGVGASQYGSLLVEELLDEQLPVLNPNLMILDFGTNNYLYDNQVKPELGPQVEKIIQNLRTISPKSIILLTSTQDLYYKSKHVTAGITFRNLMDSLAKKNNCLFWDWYAVSGGQKSLLKWRDAGYAQTDLVHLTTKGYELKGQLLFEAIKRTIDSVSINPNLGSLNLAYKETKDVVPTVIKETPPKKVVDNATVKNEQKIVSPPKKQDPPKPNPPKPAPPKQQAIKVKTHIVKKGDTLYDLAKKYKTTVAQLKKVNKLNGDNLKIGQKLTIP